MHARRFEWSDLEIFLAAARCGTLAAAAAELRLDASTIHRRVGKLETAAGARLFIRSPRGYALTEAGEVLLGHALGMEEQAHAGWRKVVAHDEQPGGTVRVATVDDFAVHILPPIVSSFRERYPNVTVNVDVRTSFVDLAKHQADVALRFGLKPVDGDVVAKVVSRANVALYASRTYLKRRGRPMRLEELEHHTVIRGDEQLAGMIIERVMDRYADPNKVAFRSNSFYARLAAIRAGVGIGFAAFYMAEADKTLERLPFHFPDAGANLMMLIHVDMRKNARVRAFVEHTHAALTAQRARFVGSN